MLHVVLARVGHLRLLLLKLTVLMVMLVIAIGVSGRGLITEICVTGTLLLLQEGVLVGLSVGLTMVGSTLVILR